MRNFVHHRFFGYLMLEMRDKRGYQLLASQRTSTPDRKYVVEDGEAREWRLFFARWDRALIIQINFLEVYHDEKQHFSVGGRLYADCCDGNHSVALQRSLEFYNAALAKLAEEVGEEEVYPLDDDFPEYPYGVGEKVDGGGGGWTVDIDLGRRFQEQGWSGAQLQSLDPTKIAQYLHSLCEPTFLLLADQFARLQVSAFPPTQSFPGCETAFWGTFPFARLRSKVRGQISGAKLPPTRRKR